MTKLHRNNIMQIPIRLNEIADYLSKANIELLRQFEDGRINASVNEDEILNILSNKLI